MKIAIAQISPVFLDRERTLAKAIRSVEDAARAGASLICFGETLVPAYPFWLARTDGARWNAPDQKELHSLYVDQSVALGPGDETGHLKALSETARNHKISVIIGVAERPLDRGGHTIYCSRVYIEGHGENAGCILSVHRKLMPTYDERLAWGAGDGAGLVTHRVGPFHVGALNCWENWMPLARAALYAAGEDLHVMLWPGSIGLTQDFTRFVALESRSYVISASVLIRAQDIPASVPHRARMIRGEDDVIQNGGSCIAGPDGKWLVEPVVNEERLILADLDPRKVSEERQNFDPSGHYARPDVLRLIVDRRRQRPVENTHR